MTLWWASHAADGDTGCGASRFSREFACWPGRAGSIRHGGQAWRSAIEPDAHLHGMGSFASFVPTTARGNINGHTSSVGRQDVNSNSRHAIGFQA